MNYQKMPADEMVEIAQENRVVAGAELEEGEELTREALAGTTFQRCKLSGEISDCDLSGSTFVDCDLTDAEFVDTDLRAVKLTKTQMYQARVSFSDLCNAIVSADLTGATFNECKMRRAKFTTDAVLTNVTFIGCNLAGVTFDCDISTVTFIGCRRQTLAEMVSL